MAKMMTRRRPVLADDIRASLREALDHASGKRTEAVVHRVVIKAEPKAVRRARRVQGLRAERSDCA
jgi:hypothetical protein